MQIEHNIDISKQALDKKFSPKTEVFLKAIIARLLEYQFNIEKKVPVGKISQLRIKDSTKFNLPNHLKEEFPGTGGCGSPATVSIQYEIDLMRGKIVSIDITPASHADQRESREDMLRLEQGCLYIRDLGYVNMDYMAAIEEQGGYYVNRVFPSMEVYQLKEGKYYPLNMKKCRSLLKGTSKFIDMKVFLGSRKLPCRLIIEAVPESVKEERVRKLNLYNKKKGFTMTDSYRMRMGLNLYVTNLPKKLYKAAVIKNVYRLRWQIELLFKGWKSILKINKHSIAKVSRVKCQLYTRLVIAIIHMFACNRLGGIEVISPYKMQKIIAETWHRLRAFIFKEDYSWISIISQAQSLLLKEHKKSRPDIKIVLSVIQ
jgi:hypothetical protein